MDKLTGMSNTRIYRCWNRMKHRCYNKNNKDFKHYGGRGIKVCREWIDCEYGFTNFYYWAINNGYTDKLTIDRIDVNGDYEPSNCRWADIITQRNNMRSNVVLTYKGKSMTMAMWARELNIPYKCIVNRYERGEDINNILSTNVRCSVKYVSFNGMTKSVHDWSEYFNIKQDTLSARLKRANYDMKEVYNKFDDMKIIPRYE